MGAPRPIGTTARGEHHEEPHTRCRVLAALLLAAGCAGDTADDAPADATDAPADATDAPADATDAPATTDDEFSFSIGLSEPATIDPGLTQEVEGAHVIRLLFEPLVTLTPDLELRPGVATAWSVADDGVTWTFDLDPAASFSDGRPVVASDFAFAFARAADPDLASPASYQGLPIAGWEEVSVSEPSGAVGDEPVSGVTAVDDHTLTIETVEPFALLPKVLTYPLFAPIAPEYVEGDEQAAAFAEQPIGNGPYMMSEPWQHNEGITVVRNPGFHGTPGGADRIELRIYSDSLTAYKDLEAGALDIARLLPAEAVEDAKGSFPDQFIGKETGTLGYIGFPTNVAPFDDPDIRLALSLAIDREAIAERVWSGTVAPATGMVPTIVPGALPGTCDACAYDPERAKALYDAAGGIPGNSMVVYDIADDGRENLDAILNSWRDVFGLDIEVRSFEFAQYLEETAPGVPVGPFELGWVWDYPSGYSILSPLFESNSGANNLSYANPAFDELMSQAREAADEEAGLEFLSEAQRLVEADLPLAPVSFANESGVYSDRLANVMVDAGSLWRLELVTPA